MEENNNEEMKPVNEAYLQLRMMFNDLMAAGFTESQSLKIVSNVALGNK